MSIAERAFQRAGVRARVEWEEEMMELSRGEIGVWFNETGEQARFADETGLHNDEERLKELAAKVIAEHIGELIVTPKEIDSIVADMTRIVADGINMALFGADYAEVRMLIA